MLRLGLSLSSWPWHIGMQVLNEAETANWYLEITGIGGCSSTTYRTKKSGQERLINGNGIIES